MATHLITGAGSGIGALVAHHLAARGDDLLLVARSDERAVHLLGRFPGATIVVADLQSADLEAALVEHGTPPEQLDSVVHVAGVVELATVEDLSVVAFLDTLKVNLVAPTVLTGWALPALRAARGTVVLVNSTAALAANPSWAAYAASKAGLKAMADALRAEEAANGVRVTTIYPSRTATPMQRKVRAQEAGDYDPSRYLDAETVAAQIVSIIDLPRDATVPDIVLRPSPQP